MSVSKTILVIKTKRIREMAESVMKDLDGIQMPERKHGQIRVENILDAIHWFELWAKGKI